MTKISLFLQILYSIQDEAVQEWEIAAFYLLDDGYKKILITTDRNPLSKFGERLSNGEFI